MKCRQYWNRTDIDQTQALWIENVKDPRLLNVLQKETNLEASFRDVLTFVNGQPKRGFWDVDNGGDRASYPMRKSRGVALVEPYRRAWPHSQFPKGISA
jgi:hypothetical protein